MAQSAPTNTTPNYLLIFIVAAVVGTCAIFAGLHFFHNKTKPVHKATPVVVVAPVVIPDEQPTYDQVVATPIAETPVVTAVKAPVKDTTVAPATPVVAPTVVTPPVHVAHPVAPAHYLNHGNFSHGNSNPNWAN